MDKKNKFGVWKKALLYLLAIWAVSFGWMFWLMPHCNASIAGFGCLLFIAPVVIMVLLSTIIIPIKAWQGDVRPAVGFAITIIGFEVVWPILDILGLILL